MKTQSPVRTLAQAGLIAAMYAALTLLLPAPSFGIVQCRISEMLTILAVFTPSAIPGLAVGCLVSNLVGLGMGANPAGAWDLLFGPLATLAAALLTWRLRNLRVKGVPVLASLPPVVINAVVVGLELTLVVEMIDPQPQTLDGCGRFGLGTYASAIRFTGLTVYRPFYEPTCFSYLHQ